MEFDTEDPSLVVISWYKIRGSRSLIFTKCRKGNKVKVNLHKGPGQIGNSCEKCAKDFITAKEAKKADVILRTSKFYFYGYLKIVQISMHP